MELRLQVHLHFAVKFLSGYKFPKTVPERIDSFIHMYFLGTNEICKACILAAYACGENHKSMEKEVF